MKQVECAIDFNFMRKFGVEFEFTREDPNSRNYISEVVRNSLREQQVNYHMVQIRDWEHTNDNNGTWVCKTDSSCGFELCTPPLRGPEELDILGKIVEALRVSGLKYNNTCGLHVHISLSDFLSNQMFKMLKYWIKIEHNIMNAHPSHRRDGNRYCLPAINKIMDWFSDTNYDGYSLYRQLKKYRGAINASYWDSRKTIEWRMGEMTLDAESVKNRIMFLIWFVEICKYSADPNDLNLLNPQEMLEFLGLIESNGGFVKKTFSPEIISMKKWIIDRMDCYMPNNASNIAEKTCLERDKKIVSKLKEEINHKCVE